MGELIKIQSKTSVLRCKTKAQWIFFIRLMGKPPHKAQPNGMGHLFLLQPLPYLNFWVGIVLEIPAVDHKPIPLVPCSHLLVPLQEDFLTIPINKLNSPKAILQLKFIII